MSVGVWGLVAHRSTERPNNDALDLVAGAPSAGADGLEGHLSWALELIDGAQPTLAEIEDRLAPSFLDAMTPSMFLAQTEIVTDAAPYRFHGFATDEESGIAAAMLVGTDDLVYAITLSVDPVQPDRIDALLILPAEVDRGPFSTVEITLHLLTLATLVVSAVVLWMLRARPRSLGVAVVAMVWSLHLLEIADGVAYSVGLLSGPLAVAAMAAVVVTGRADWPPRRMPMVVGAVFVVAAVAWSPLTAIDTSAVSLPDQVLAFGSNPDRARWLVSVSGWGLATAAAAMVVHLLVRQFRADWSDNRGEVATTLAGSAGAAMVAVAAVLPALDSSRFDLSVSPLVSVAMVVAAAGVVSTAAWERYDLGHVAAELEAENVELHAEVQAQLAEVRASRARIVQAGDEARRSVERDLHDGAQQRLLAAQLSIRMGRTRFAADDPDLDAYMAALADDIGTALNELREISRGLHPAILEEGVVAAAQALAETSAIPTTVMAEPDVGRFPSEVEHAAYYVLSEALTNATRHSGASHVGVAIENDATGLRISVRDDGGGGAVSRGGAGLVNLEDRVTALGGTWRLTSVPGDGTEIVAVLPCG